MVKNTVKSFVRENKFHTYLTRETLPTEERVSTFYNHGKTPSHPTFAEASMRKFVLKSHLSLLKGNTKRPFFVLRLGPSITIILVKLSAAVGKIAQTTWRMVHMIRLFCVFDLYFTALYEKCDTTGQISDYLY